MHRAGKLSFHPNMTTYRQGNRGADPGSAPRIVLLTGLWSKRVAQLKKLHWELESAQDPGDIARLLSERLGFTQADLAAATGADPRAVASWLGSEALMPEDDEHKERLHQLKALIDLIMEDGSIAEEPAAWFRYPNLSLDHRTPFELIAKGCWRQVGSSLCEQLGIPRAVWPQPFRSRDNDRLVESDAR
jgi:transcriptional regulator with XRE-family HTH domain